MLDGKQEISISSGHNSQISNISIQPNSGLHILTTATNEVILWDLNTFQRRCKLCLNESLEIILVNNFYV